MKRYSIIIPTMWYRLDCLIPMLEQYERSRYVGEVIIINNRRKGYPRTMGRYKKVRVINDGNNLFVNPSWNLGVSVAEYENIILANDDIVISDVSILLGRLSGFLGFGYIIGPGRMCFAQKRRHRDVPVFRVFELGGQDYGFGTFMLMEKSSYVYIPEQMKVWFGDTFLCHKLKPYAFEGVDVKTDMRSTSRRLPLRMQHIEDKNYFESLKL